MTDESYFAGKVALVTGSGSGIGRATALAFASAGATVIVTCRGRESGEATVRMIANAGGFSAYIPADLTKEQSIETMVHQTVRQFGRLDIAVNNAGNPGRNAPLTEQTVEDYDFTLDGNLKSVWLCMKHEIRQMLTQGGGAIVNTASNLAHVGYPNLSLYVAAKSAVVGLTRAAALEYARDGIRINAVSPGPIETELAERVFGSVEAFRRELGPKQPLGRVGLPSEIASVILWLASDAASLITGQALLADGGASSQ